jgi:ribosomal protein S12 methylthiotransferase accessory factor
MSIKTFNQHLLEECCNFRCGIVLPYQQVPRNFCDISNVYNYSVPGEPAETWKTASGALSSDENLAIVSAIAESLERYCGAICDFELKKTDALSGKDILYHSDFALFSEEQYADPDFPWKKPNPADSFYCKAYSLYDNSEVYVPQELAGLGSRHENVTIPSTSNGLAAHSSIYDALFSALLELLERDALTVYWLNSIGGREIPLDEKYTEEVNEKGGQILCFDITQDWNPFPVVAVCGYLLMQGKKRISLGVACRPDYASAIQKAYFEWIQGCIFAGYYDVSHPDLTLDNKSMVNSFDLHAVYYTKRPQEWETTPLIKNRKPHQPNEKMGGEKSLESILRILKSEKIRLYYKDLTTVDVKDAGLTVVRVMSPDLSLLHGDENIPFLGGRTSDVKWRYKNLECGEFPNRYPHPLG